MANGRENLIYLEIDSGPYLVNPANTAFDNGERPINQHKDNIVWLDDKSLKNILAEDVSATLLWCDTSAYMALC